MGLGQRKSKGGKGGHKTKNKEYKKGHATKNRRKDVDQIQDELKVEEEKEEETVFDVDDDLPGQGQFYCTPCARHFTDDKTKVTHIRSKVHKRRMKDVAQEQYTQDEAERGAGMMKERYPPAHPALRTIAVAVSTATPPSSSSSSSSTMATRTATRTALATKPTGGVETLSEASSMDVAAAAGAAAVVGGAGEGREGREGRGADENENEDDDDPDI